MSRFYFLALTLFQADGSFYVCDSEVKKEAERKRMQSDTKNDEGHDGDAVADEGYPSRTWTSTAQIWSDFVNIDGNSGEWGSLRQDSVTIPVLVPDVVSADDESSSKIFNWKVKRDAASVCFNIGFERPCGHAHLINSLGITVWEGELEDGRPEKSSTIVNHLMADIMSGNSNVAVLIFHVTLLLQMSNYRPTSVSRFWADAHLRFCTGLGIQKQKESTGLHSLFVCYHFSFSLHNGACLWQFLRNPSETVSARASHILHCCCSCACLSVENNKFEVELLRSFECCVMKLFLF